MKKHMMAVLILIMSILCITACGSNAEEIDWENIVLGDVIPEPQSNKMEILSNDNEWLNIDIEKISENEYYEYQCWCGEDKGFTIDTENYGTSFYGYNQDGYYLSLYYNDSEEELNIDLQAPIPLTEYDLPDFAINNGLPLPDSKVGSYHWEYEDSFYLYVGETTIEGYNAYKDKCIDAGFTVEPYEGLGFYSAANSDGYDLSIGYKGFDTMYIEMSYPEDSLEIDDSSEEIIEAEESEPEVEEIQESEKDTTLDSHSIKTDTDSNDVVIKDIVMPYACEDYYTDEWTLESITEHFNELGFTNIRPVACDPDDDKYDINIFQLTIETGWFSTDPWVAGDKFDSDAEISIYYNEFPVLTVENCPDLLTVLTSQDMYYKTFAEKYDGRYVEFDAYVTTHTTYDGGTSHIINVTGGDYTGENEIGHYDQEYYDGLIIRIGDRTWGNSINESVEEGDPVTVSGRIDLSWSEYYKTLYVETRYLGIR